MVSSPGGNPSFINAPVSAVVAHHRAHPGNANKRFFVVIDRVDWANEGVLGVNLNFDGESASTICLFTLSDKHLEGNFVCHATFLSLSSNQSSGMSDCEE